MATVSAWSEVVAKAWSDDEYKKRLLSDPIPLLREEGFQIPDGATVTILVETTPNHRTFILPPKPAAQITDAGAAASDSVWTVTF
jgi:hypothetical protein